MTDNEFTQGIINGTFGKIGVLEFCSNFPDLKYLEKLLIAELTVLQTNKERRNLTYCVGNWCSLEEGRLYDAIEWVRSVMEQPEPEPEPEPEAQRSSILDTLPYPDRAKKYFAKAIERGWIEKDGEEHYKWVFGSKTSLAYFCYNVFCPSGTEYLPEKKLNKLFNVNRLGAAKTSAYDLNQAWKPTINELFKD